MSFVLVFMENGDEDNQDLEIFISSTSEEMTNVMLYSPADGTGYIDRLPLIPGQVK